MKKRNLFICLIFAILMCFPFGFSSAKNRVFAEGESTTATIIFDAAGGVCSTESIVINKGETLSTIPEATLRGHIFIGWELNSVIIDSSTTFSEDTTTLTATYVRKLYKYTISKPDTHFLIVGETTDSTKPYTLAADCETLESAISLISEDSATKSIETVVINFKNISLTQNLNLAFDSVEITGTLNLSEYNVVFNPTSNTSTIKLTELVLNATSSIDFVKIAGTNSSTIYVSDVTFTSTSNENNYAIKLENPIHTIHFLNDLSFSSQYLYNFELADGNPDFQRKARFDSTFNLVSPAKISITIPYNADYQSILTSALETPSLFAVYPNQSNFTCILQPNMNGGNLVVNTYFNFSFNPNGGDVIKNFTTTNTNFNIANPLNFPTEENYSKTHSSLNGYVAKITLDAQTMSKYSIDSSVWYFDINALESFIDAGSNISSIPTHFYSESDFSNINAFTLSGFTYYKYDRSASDKNFLATNLMLKLGQTPEFIAIWTDTQYSISFNENEGEEVSDLTGIFGSAVTLPNPTRTGYDFVGWFESLDLANEALESNKVTLSSMPDTNQTLYAGWSIRTHTLSIYYNNQTATRNISTIYGTTINTIAETQPENFSKKGYTFNGWYTDAGLTNALAETDTMPDSNYSIYAKWTINQYTITLYYNHPSVEEGEIFKTTTQEYNSDVRSIFSTDPYFEGYTFNRWCTDKNYQYPLTTLPQTMPDSNLTLYASWTQPEYVLTINYPAMGTSTKKYLHFAQELPLVSPVYSGLIFEGWFVDENFSTPLTATTMPNESLTVYAKLTEKKTLTLTFDAQTYTLSNNNGFVLPENLEGFTIEYLVNDNWTITMPTKKGVYDVRISRSENETHKAFLITIEKGLTITANMVDIGIYVLIFYCVGALELICAIIILFIRKQRKTYLAYVVTLPFGLVTTSQFTNFAISLVLAVFGFILLVIQIVKLKQVNNEIANTSSENKEYTPPDVSENKSISRNVEILLQREGFVSATEHDDDEIKNDDILSPEPDDKSEPETTDDEYLSFDSKKDDDDINY